jgi:hypothetical protein
LASASPTVLAGRSRHCHGIRFTKTSFREMKPVGTKYLHGRYELKLAMAQGLEGLANHATSMLGPLFYLPAILLWLAATLIGAALGWKVLPFGTRFLFAAKRAGGVEAAPSVTAQVGRSPEMLFGLRLQSLVRHGSRHFRAGTQSRGLSSGSKGGRFCGSA